MAERILRNNLYDLVWSEPLRSLSARFGISDVALRKTCTRALIPTPDRGYWAKREAGRSTFRIPLPPRPPGMDQEVLVAAGHQYWYGEWKTEELLGPLPPPPEFSESIETVRERIVKVVGPVTVPNQVRLWHPAIDRLLKEDQARRENLKTTMYPLSSEKPRFDSAWERRRLRILNSLFIATSKMNAKPSIDLFEGFRVHFAFFWRHFWVKLDKPAESNRRKRGKVTEGESEDSLSFSILSGSSPEVARATWQDDEHLRLESHLAEIAVELILTAEVLYREQANSQYEWRVKRKTELEEAQRQRQLALERAEIERKERLEKARVDRLLMDASAFQQATEIRRYVESIHSVLLRMGHSVSEDLELWTQWALAQADRIDPSVASKFLSSWQHDDRTDEAVKDGPTEG